MQGLMMDVPLTIDAILDRAEQIHGRAEIVSRRGDRSLHRTTYGEVAARIRRPQAARAVGAALGSNPIPIVVPCHRVVGATGALTGYAGGLARKTFLLQLEGQPTPETFA